MGNRGATPREVDSTEITGTRRVCIQLRARWAAGRPRRLQDGQRHPRAPRGGTRCSGCRRTVRRWGVRWGTAVRIGGDEFAVLLPGSGADAAARRFPDLPDVPVLLDGHRLPRRPSVGAAPARARGTRNSDVLVELRRAAGFAHQLTGRVDRTVVDASAARLVHGEACACSCSRRAAALAWPSGLSGSTPVGSCAFIGSLPTVRVRRSRYHTPHALIHKQFATSGTFLARLP